MRTKIVGDDFQTLFQFIMYLIGGAVIAIGTILTITGKRFYRALMNLIELRNILFKGKIAPWTGRFYTLLDPSYAKNHIPIIASVSEHQPTSWSSFYFDLHIQVFLFPVGLYFCFSKLTDANIFVILYGVTSIYFAVRIFNCLFVVVYF